MIEPLPFTIRPPKSDSWSITGTKSVQIRVDGLLHLEDDVLVFEWTETRTTQSFGFERLGTDVQRYETEVIELPVEWIAEVRARIWFRGPQIFFRARRLDAFDGVPSAGPGTLLITVPFRHRRLLRPMFDAIEAARASAHSVGLLPSRRSPPAEEGRTPV